MSRHIIDRRKNDSGKSIPNRQKFIKRVKKQVKKQVADTIRSGNITDIVKDKQKNIHVPVKDIKEPTFHHDPNTGKKEFILPGNDRFVEGDKIPKPPSDGEGNGDGQEGSDGDPFEEEFVFTLSKEEFIEYFFEDLELPDLVQKELSKTEETVQRRAGYSTDGPPSRLDYLRSMQQSVGRRLVLRNAKKKRLKRLQEEYNELNQQRTALVEKGGDISGIDQQLNSLADEIEKLKRKLKAIPFIDDVDLSYRQFINEPQPIYNAVMFCLMDVSASMGEFEKELAKRFFIFLYLFLYKGYDYVKLIFVRHHTQAQEVSEEEFFYGRETGGTVVSSGLELINNIIDERFPLNQWNVYIAQCSDGDNMPPDQQHVEQLMKSKLLPKVQYFCYVEIGEMTSRQLLDLYRDIQKSHQNLACGVVESKQDIYPVFRTLFKKKGAQ